MTSSNSKRSGAFKALRGSAQLSKKSMRAMARLGNESNRCSRSIPSSRQRARQRCMGIIPPILILKLYIPSMPTLDKVAKHLGVSIEELYMNDDEAREPDKQ